MIGKRVQMLVVVERLPGGKVRCVCDCGKERVANVGHFNTGQIKSCGCTRFQKYPDGAHGPCIVEGCENDRCNSRGYCWMHYMRWRRHGDPLHVAETGQREAWLRSMVSYDGDDCLIWPFGFSDTGYGMAVFGGEVGGASPMRPRSRCASNKAGTLSPHLMPRCGVWRTIDQ